MKNIFILFFILFFHSAFGQQTIDKLNANQLKLPKESVNKALYLDGSGQVKSSATITDTELGYLEGLSDTLVNLLSGKANDSDVVKLTGNQSVDGEKTFTGKLVASSTVNGSIPCPVMTETERDLFTPVEGDCIYNSDTLKLNIYDGSVWKDVGGAGGISLWLTANPYNVNDIIIESDKIYRCLIAHTSGVFATDLAASKWTEVSSSPVTPYSLNDGGTGSSLTASNGGIVWVDADSFEILSAGVSGQVLQSNGAASPSWVNKSISGKAENASSITLEEIQVSNNQLTQTDTNKHLVETGNTNILANPSFEHSTFSTGWTNVAGTFAVESTVVVHGKKSAKVTLSSQAFDLSQDSTLYQAQFVDGVQGLASVRVKTTVAGLRVCSRQNGIVTANLCVNVQANGKWGLYKVPFILGGTSNGISINSNGTSVTGDVYVDDAFVGAVDLSADVDQSRFYGSWTENGAANCNRQITSTAYTAFPVDADCSSPIVSGAITATPTKLLAFNMNAEAGTYQIVPMLSILNSITANIVSCKIVANGISSSEWTRYARDGGFEAYDQPSVFTISLPAAFNGQFELQCKSSTSMTTVSLNIANMVNSFYVFKLGSGSVYSSTNADTDWASCGHTTSDFTGFGTVTNIETQCKREGSDLLMRGRFTSGTTTAVEARLNLKIGGTALTSASSSIIPSLQIVGNSGRTGSTSAEYNVTLIEPSVSYMTFGISATSLAPLSKANGTNILINGNSYSFTARIPISGWQNSNIIIGQFNGLESCFDSYECTDTFSASVSVTGVVSNENIDWINGNCSVSDTSLFTCPYKSGLATVPMNCTPQIDDANSTDAALAKHINTSSSSQLVFRTGYTSTPPIITKAAYATKIICQKQGVDYIGKTAKAVASDQNTRSPGLTKSVIVSAEVSSAGVVSQDESDFINGNCVVTDTSLYTCTWSTNFWSIAPKCIPNTTSGNNGLKTDKEAIPTTSLGAFRGANSTTGAKTATGFTLLCHGATP